MSPVSMNGGDFNSVFICGYFMYSCIQVKTWPTDQFSKDFPSGSILDWFVGEDKVRDCLSGEGKLFAGFVGERIFGREKGGEIFLPGIFRGVFRRLHLFTRIMVGRGHMILL